VLKNQVKPLLFIALHIIIFPPFAEYSRVLTVACDVVQLRKTWNSTMMMVPMHKLHPSLVKILVVSVIDGASVDADLLVVFVILFVSDLQVHDVRLIQMSNYVIMRYTLIFALMY
jgi:hypothetical protein